MYDKTDFSNSCQFGIRLQDAKRSRKIKNYLEYAKCGTKMILNHKKWQDFENNLKRKEKMSVSRKFTVMDALYREAVELKILPMKDPLEGLDVKIKVAKAVNRVNSVPKTP